ncbi:MAG TPA: mechanosensitive ion channel family protein [Anaerolineaceae bacterium]|nr:mechanosensitive ion channel family protein [Anaerolineaceae bacterium]
MQELLDNLFSRLREYFDPERIGGFLAEALISLLIFIIVLGIFYLIWKLTQRMFMPRLQRNMDSTNAAFAETILKFFVFSIGLLAALSAMGVQTSAVLASLGVVGLTIGFALRDTLSNIISGFLIFIDRPFTIGDLIEIDGKYGRVDRISLRTTRVVTPDGKMLAVPNAEVMNKTVTSYTNFPNIRLDISVTVGVHEDLDQVRKILLDLVHDNPDYLDKPEPSVVVTQLNDYNIGLELRVWLENEREHMKKKFELRELVFKTLTSKGVDMPFETIQSIQVKPQ